LRARAQYATPKSLLKREIAAAKPTRLKPLGGAKGFDGNQLPDNLFEAHAQQKEDTSLILESSMYSHECLPDGAEGER
ncbi:trigger factor, partial [Francisella tularensis subsp. holarctica]|nr:trigger factor [Francisella tularensis subsp. holarctica]